ncbi:MAG: coproporphyrinogen-III oxidase family protein [Candidatus Helarchaeota archaeon]
MVKKDYTNYIEHRTNYIEHRTFADINYKGFLKNHNNIKCPSFIKILNEKKLSEYTQGNLSLYFHIPFCLSKCFFCFFNTITINGINKSYVNKIITKYTHDLKYELLKYLDVGAFDKTSIISIYIGGGSPSILPPFFIKMLLNVLNQITTLKNDTEISIEINPKTIRNVDIEKINHYYDYGINRLSFGVQTTNDTILKKLNRKQNWKKIKKLIRYAEKVGFDNINIDLLYGMPYQTINSTIKDLYEVFSLNPAHLSIYHCGLKENTIIYKKLQLGEKIPILSKQEQYKLWDEIQNTVKNYGYIQTTTRHFVKNLKYQQRHELNVWSGGNVIGFGLGAYSFLDPFIYNNTINLDYYHKLCNKKDFPIGICTKLTKYDLERRYILLNFRLLKLDIKKFENKFKIDINDIFGDRIEELISRQLCIMEDNKIKLTKKGINQIKEDITKFFFDFQNTIFKNWFWSFP